jgi:hypothetical protein
MLNPQNLKPGQEQYETFYSAILRKHKVQYDYRDANGKLYSCVANSLKEARAKVQNMMNKGA